MKHLSVYLLLILCSFATLTSCSDDDDKIDDPIVGKWNLKELQKVGPVVTSGAFFMNWNAPSGTTIQISNGEQVLDVPVSTIPAMVEPTASNIIAQVLRDVTFLPNGKIEATYSDAGFDAVTPTTPTWKTAKDYATYTINDAQLLVFLNLEKIAPALMGGRASSEPDMSVIVDLITKGIPVNYAIETDNTAIVYVDKDLIVKLLPLLQIYAADIQDTDFNNMGALVKNIINNLPAVLEKTTKLEIGLHLVRATTK